MGINKFDDLLAMMGTGRWNAMVFLTISYWHMHLVSNALSGVFVAPAVNHTCIPPDHGYTLTSYIRMPSGKNVTTADHCQYYTNETQDGSFQSEACTDWEYDNSTYSLTLTSQFDLVCSSEYLRATYQSLYMFGTLFGAPINGLVSDRYGRKLTLTLAVLVYFSLAMATSWLTTLTSILAFRFILGFLHPAIMQSGYILALEVFEPRYRAALGILLSLTWAMGTMAWGGVAYLIRDWRWLQLVVNLSSLFIFPMLWFLDESPRWLIVHGKFDRATKTLEKAARWHRVTLPPRQDLHTLMLSIREESTTTKRAEREERVRTYKQKAWHYLQHLLVLFKTPKLRLYTCTLCLNFFLVAFIWYGMSLNAVNYSADPFLYMVLSGVVDVPAYVVTAVVVSYLGRKWPSIVLFLISGASIVAAGFVPSDMNTVVMVLALMGRMCISSAYQIVYLYCVELIPTEVRLQGIGYCTIVSRIGSILSPFITELLGSKMGRELRNFDDLLNQLGTGKWNLLYFLTTSVWFGLIPPQVLSGAYLTPALNATCTPPPPHHAFNSIYTIAQDSCSYQYVRAEGEEVVVEEACTEWTFDTSVYSTSITSDFGLVCSKEYLRATYTSLFMMGNFISPPIGGYLADRFGRWLVVVVSLAVFTAGGVIISFLHSMPLILATRFIMGTANLATLYILAMEVCETRLRAVVGILTALPWALGTMAWGGIAYLIRDWRWLQLVVTLPNLLLFPALWLMDESPRWLIVRGRHDKALRVLHKAARWNKVTLPPETQLRTLMEDIRREAEMKEVRDLSKKETDGGRKCCNRLSFTPDLCRPGVRQSIIIMSIDFFIASMVFYGLNLNGSNLSTDPYLYMVLAGLMEVPAYTLTAPVLNRFGRKVPTVIGYFVSGVSILALAFISMDLTWAVLTLAMVGKMCISAVYQTLYVYVTELMPTEVRIQGMGTVKVTSRVGSMISPFITDFLGQVSGWAPSLVFGGVSVVAGVATLWARETRRTPLPDTISSLQHTAKSVDRREEGDSLEVVDLKNDADSV